KAIRGRSSRPHPSKIISYVPGRAAANTDRRPLGTEGRTMGMEQTVTFSVGRPVPWPSVRDLLVSHGFPVEVRMIDGELAFPNEEPPENWRELRLATSEGLVVTARREQDRVVLAGWGNA